MSIELRPFDAYFTYGRCGPGPRSSVRARLQWRASREVEKVGCQFPPRQNSQIRR
jgi:hypothetical protein